MIYNNLDQGRAAAARTGGPRKDWGRWGWEEPGKRATPM